MRGIAGAIVGTHSVLNQGRTAMVVRSGYLPLYVLTEKHLLQEGWHGSGQVVAFYHIHRESM